MYNLADLPAVRAQFERDAAAAQQEQAPADEPGPIARTAPAVPAKYARAPVASGAQPVGGRPPATQGHAR